MDNQVEKEMPDVRISQEIVTTPLVPVNPLSKFTKRQLIAHLDTPHFSFLKKSASGICC